MTATAGLERLHEKMLIGGEWVTSLGDDWLEMENPATEEIIGQIPDATTADADVAIAAAVEAFESGAWSHATPAERAEMVARVAEGLRVRTDELNSIYVRDRGGVAAFAPFMAETAAMIADDFAARGRTLSLEPENRETPVGRATTFREPVGPVASIVPWNAPLALAMVKIAPALIAGCPVVVKVSPEGALAVGFPPGSELPPRRTRARPVTHHRVR